MRILVVGAGVIGSVYAGKLLTAGHEVVLLARGRRLADLQASGLILEEAQSGKRTALPVTAVAALDSADRYDLVLVPVRSEQLTSTLPVLSSMRDGSDVLFFGNTAGRQAQLVEALGSRVLFGFPAAGGTRDGSVVRYVLIGQQQTMLGEPNGATTSRTRHLKTMLQDAGFPTTITANMDGWLLGHAAFVVPIACALYRVDTDASRLAADRDTLRLMVRATRQAFQALRTSGNNEIPANLRTLYLRLPATFAVRLLASGTSRSSRGTLVRRPQPRRSGGDAGTRRGPASRGRPNRSSRTRSHNAALTLLVDRLSAVPVGEPQDQPAGVRLRHPLRRRPQGRRRRRIHQRRCDPRRICVPGCQ